MRWSVTFTQFMKIKKKINAGCLICNFLKDNRQKINKKIKVADIHAL